METEIQVGPRTPEERQTAREILAEIHSAMEPYIVPSEDKLQALLDEAQVKGCGLVAIEGKPGTLQVSIGVPAGTLITVREDVSSSWVANQK